MKYTELEIIDMMLARKRLEKEELEEQVDFYLKCVRNWNKVVFKRHIKYVESYIKLRDLGKVGKDFEHSTEGMVNLFNKILVLLEIGYKERYQKVENS